MTLHFKDTEWLSVEPIVAGIRLWGNIGSRTVITDSGELWNELIYDGEIYKHIIHDRASEHTWRTLGTFDSGYNEHLKVCVLFCDHCRTAKADSRWDFV